MYKNYKWIKVNGRCMYLHRHIMEQYLGRKLKSYEHVHHINGNSQDNSINNLELTNAHKHGVIHKPKPYAERIDILCEGCGKTFSMRKRDYKYKMKIQKTKKVFCSGKCRAKILGMPQPGPSPELISKIREGMKNNLSRRRISIVYKLPLSSVRYHYNKFLNIA